VPTDNAHPQMGRCDPAAAGRRARDQLSAPPLVSATARVTRRSRPARLRVFPGDLHDVLNEHDRDAVHDVVATFLVTVIAGRRTPLAS
jgi:hypothetical protein